MNSSAASTANRSGIGVIGAIALGVAIVALRRPTHRRPPSSDDRRQAFITYLRDHLTGADAAIQTVAHLAESHRDAPEGALFASLHEQLEADHAVVRSLLADLGASSRSIRRLAGRAAGVALRTADGEPGDLSLFRALEALAVGIQGKRCLWRAGQALSPAVRPRGPRDFPDLEADAIKQWEAVEGLRLSYAPQTFG
jgi:hypothetical protein